MMLLSQSGCSKCHQTFPITSSFSLPWSAFLCSWRAVGTIFLSQGRVHTWMLVVPLWPGPRGTLAWLTSTSASCPASHIPTLPALCYPEAWSPYGVLDGCVAARSGCIFTNTAPCSVPSLSCHCSMAISLGSMS